MGLLGNLEHRVQDWVLKKALGRAAVSLARAALALATAHSGALASVGITVTANPDVIAGGLLTAFHVGGSYLGHKWPRWFGWLS